MATATTAATVSLLLLLLLLLLPPLLLHNYYCYHYYHYCYCYDILPGTAAYCYCSGTIIRLFRARGANYLSNDAEHNIFNAAIRAI